MYVCSLSSWLYKASTVQIADNNELAAYLQAFQEAIPSPFMICEDERFHKIVLKTGALSENNLVDNARDIGRAPQLMHIPNCVEARQQLG